ncbi:hypothetical protein TNIN_473631 [Trichonephila inaurata madagascariensis]|uniref:Uncharacterized protein n=1 Tax=Trichonephila inaurata madagascariensis TaxID=2747483 RepID=A0A8X7BU04_9ARAC|nr:hypothetical protein TNIN_473631 [Trichonephila inaurata madagascariensis]
MNSHSRNNAYVQLDIRKPYEMGQKNHFRYLFFFKTNPEMMQAERFVPHVKRAEKQVQPFNKPSKATSFTRNRHVRWIKSAAFTSPTRALIIPNTKNALQRPPTSGANRNLTFFPPIASIQPTRLQPCLAHFGDFLFR